MHAYAMVNWICHDFNGFEGMSSQQMSQQNILLYESPPAETRLTVYRRLPSRAASALGVLTAITAISVTPATVVS